MFHIKPFILLSFFFILSLSTKIIISYGDVNSEKLKKCEFLNDHWRFDYAFTEHIQKTHNSISNHYIISKGIFFKIDSISASYHYPLSASGDQKNEFSNEDIKPSILKKLNLAINVSYNASYYDLSFTYLDSKQNIEKTMFCSLRLSTFDITCLEMRHYYERDFTTPETFGHNITRKIRLPSNFLPSVVFQPVEYLEYDNSRYVILFMEQTPVFNASGVEKWSYGRRFLAYSFFDINNIINVSHSITVPPHYLQIDKRVEITGIFSFKKDEKHQFFVTAFDGKHHIYCYNNDCFHLDKYRIFMGLCNPSQNIYASNGGRPLQMIDLKKKFAKIQNERDEAPEAFTEVEYLEKQKEFRKTMSFIWNWSIKILLFIIANLALLIFYYHIKENIIRRQRTSLLEKTGEKHSDCSSEALTSEGTSHCPTIPLVVTIDEQHLL